MPVRVMPPIEEEEDLPMCEFIVSAVPPKLANGRFKLLNKVFPLHDYPHIKRVRREQKKGENGSKGDITLQVVVAPVHSVLNGMDDAVIDQLQAEDLLPSALPHTHVGGDNVNSRQLIVDAAIEKGMIQLIPARPPLVRWQFEAVKDAWPITFKPVTRPDAPIVNDSNVAEWARYMQDALEQARIAAKLGQLPRGGIIVDPSSQKVVAAGFDLTSSWTAELQAHLQSDTYMREVCERRPAYVNPLFETAMVLADIVARRHCHTHGPLTRKGMNAEKGGGVGKEKETASSRERKDSDCTSTSTLCDSSPACASPSSISATSTAGEPTTATVTAATSTSACGPSATTSISDMCYAVSSEEEEDKRGERKSGRKRKSDDVASQSADTLHTDKEEGGEEQYLCTGYDAYLTHEPSTMSAMCLLHSRIRRVIIALPSHSRQAPLTGKTRLHAHPHLNHRFDVVVGVLEEEVEKSVGMNEE